MEAAFTGGGGERALSFISLEIASKLEVWTVNLGLGTSNASQYAVSHKTYHDATRGHSRLH